MCFAQWRSTAPVKLGYIGSQNSDCSNFSGDLVMGVASGRSVDVCHAVGFPFSCVTLQKKS